MELDKFECVGIGTGMTIDMIAKLKTYEDFVSAYQPGDELQFYRGKSLLFFAVSNNDPENRFCITEFLLERKTDATGVNESGENLFHILFSRNKHNLSRTLVMTEQFLQVGVDINRIDEKGRLPLQYVINMPYSDEELEPLYDLILSKNLNIAHKNAWGYSPIDLAMKVPYRGRFLKKVEEMGNQISV